MAANVHASSENVLFRGLDLVAESKTSAELRKTTVHAEMPSLLSRVSDRASPKPGGREGRVITFYSYKGGVGRSRALANVALQLARRGNSVVCLDFDLEAPGLADYFKGGEFRWTGEEPDNHPGLIDLFCAHRDNLLSRFPRRGMRGADVLQTIKIGETKSEIGFVGPGRQGRDYKQLVCSFDWRSFYEDWCGGAFMAELRREFTAKYDYVLVDSRTGFNDISGVCTVQLPDVLVAVFTPGPQSQKGLVDALECVEANRIQLRPKEPLHIVPLPCRVDRDVAREAFARVAYDSWFEHLLGSYFAKKVLALGGGWRPDEYFRSVAVEYFSKFVYEDTLESFVHHIDDEAGNAWKYRNLIKAIDSVAPIELSASALGLHSRIAMSAQPTFLREFFTEEVFR